MIGAMGEVWSREWFILPIVLGPFLLIYFALWLLDKFESPTRAIRTFGVCAALALIMAVFSHWPWYQCILFAVGILGGIWLLETWEHDLIESAARRAVEIIVDKQSTKS
jgi:hypothetical protein